MGNGEGAGLVLPIRSRNMRALEGGILVAQRSPEGGLLPQDPEPRSSWLELGDLEAGTLAFTLSFFTIPILLLYREKHGWGKEENIHLILDVYY